jgi:transposase-like protein
MNRCPTCGSTNVKRNKYGGEVNLLGFYCKKCEIVEQKREDEPGFAAWCARWTAPEAAP